MECKVKVIKGRKAGTFSHLSIPPVEPEEAFTSVTPQDGNTHKKKRRNKHKEK